MSPNIAELANLIISMLCYSFVLLFIFNLLKVNYFNPIVKAFVTAYKPISKLSIFPNQLYMIGLIAVGLKFAGFQIALASQSLSSEYQNSVLLIIAVIQILRIGIDIIFYSVIGSVILSWVSPEKTNPALELIDEISNKVLSPVRNFIPSAGGIDFSPIFIFIAISMISSFLQDIIRSIA